MSTSVISSRSDFSLTNVIFSFQTPGIETFEAAAHPRQYSSHSGNSDVEVIGCEVIGQLVID